jgi:phosphoglycolate phosphatase-like HAD superfamily hydrolase
VGFDLDLTLVDSAAGIGATLRAALAAEGSRERPPDERLHRYIGIPLEATVAEVAPDADPKRVAGRYRELYPTLGVPGTTLLPGVEEAFAAVRARKGLILVVSAKVEPAVRAVLEHVGLDAPPLGPDLVVGGLFAAGKGLRLRAAGADVYVGDHPGDMEAARVAGALGVAVATGGTPCAELLAAGADVVLPGLTAFPEWFDEQFAAVPVPSGPGLRDGPGTDSAASGAGLDDEAREGDGEADRAEQGQRRHGAGG